MIRMAGRGLGTLAIIAMGVFALEMVGMALLIGRIGLGLSLLWLFMAGVAGVWLLRQTGLGLAPDLMQAALRGETPTTALWRAGGRFLAGLLLIFPGVFSDALALLLLLWGGLPGLAGGGARAPRGGAQPPRGGAEGPSVIEGEFRRED